MMPLRRVGVLFGLLAGLVVAVVPIASVMHGHTKARLLKLVFADDFAGSRLSTSHWSTCYWWASHGCTIATNHELEWYLPGQVKVGNRIARLVAERRAVRASNDLVYPFVSGMISSGPTSFSSRPKFAFRYGRVEASMRITAQPGLWPAFWMLPANERELPEIDIMEIHGQAPTVVEMHLHYRGPRGGEAVLGSTWTQPSLTSGWHTFGIDWSPGRLEWLIDGVVRWEVQGSAVPRQPMYLIANLAVGGDPVGAPPPGTRFPSALEIRRVELWQ
jgi:beta-glucanase (GH16 family)